MQRLAAIACLGLLVAAGSASAAGGHHAVDDAVTLEMGQCLLETWADAFRGGRGDWHLGPSCRFGALEFGLNVDGIHLPGKTAYHGLSPQVKWAAEISPGFLAGIVVSVTTVDGHYSSIQPLVPLTFQVSQTLAVHLNAGRDFARTGLRRRLAGIAAEWAPVDEWGFVAERFNDVFGRAARLGVRWQPNPLFSIDVSRARPFGDTRGPWWTVGATYVFERAASR